MRWFLVDTIDQLVLGDFAIGTKTYADTEPFFQDHFPNFPVVPGVLIMESLAQISGKLIGYTVRKDRGDWPFPILSMMNRVKFRKFIPPNTCITLETKIKVLKEESALVNVRAKVAGKVHAQAEQLFVFNSVPLEEGESERLENLERTELLRLWKDCPEHHS